MCRSDVDNEACLYADKVRAIRQREYDNATLYTDFKQFMLTAPQGGSKSGIVSQNTAATYFAIFKAGIKQAHYLTVNAILL